MLPISLSGSYKRYKTDTTAFTAWLLQTAVKCGWKTSWPTARISNGAKYTTTTSDLRIQAEFVAKSTKPRIQIPASVIEVVTRCIDARERCAAWYNRADGDEDMADDDGGHIHFISVLKDIVDVLSPCIMKPNSQKGAKGTNKKNDVGAKDQLPSSSTFQNSYSVLEVDEATEFLQQSACDSVQSTKTKKQDAANATAVYDSLSSRESEAIFDIYCFFEDLHELQDHLEGVWNRYKAQEIDVITAALVTNSALELVRRAENDLFDTVSSHLPEERSFTTLLCVIFKRDLLEARPKLGLNLSYTNHCPITPFDEFLYIPTARTLLRWLDFKGDDLLPYQLIPPFELDYILFKPLLGREEIKKAWRRDTLLIQLLMDMRFLAHRPPYDGMANLVDFPDCEDIFTQAERILWQTENLHTWIVFTSRIIIMINEILGEKEIVRPFKEMQDMADKARGTIDIEQLFKSEMYGCFKERWRSVDHSLILQPLGLSVWHCAMIPTLFASAKDTTMNSAPPEAWHMTFRNRAAIPATEVAQDIESLEWIRPHEEATLPFSHNPLYSGTIMMRVLVGLQTAGLALTNYHRSILSISHLYNAARQGKLLRVQWPELEKYVEKQMAALFGSKLPTNPQAMHSRLLTRMGCSTTNFTPLDRSKSCACVGVYSKNQMQYLLRSSPVVSVLQQFYAEEFTWEQCLYRLNSLRGAQAGGKQKSQHVWRLEPLEYLPRLEACISQASIELQDTDYLTMSRESDKSLDLIRAIINRYCDDPWPKNPTSPCHCTHELEHIHMVCDILSDCAREDSKFKDYQTNTNGIDGCVIGGDAIKLAAEVLTKFIAKKLANTKNSAR